MLTLLKHLNAQQPRDELTQALLRFAVLALESIRLHAVAGDGADYERFQADILRLEETFATPPSPTEVLITAGALSKTLDDYARNSSRFLLEQKHEFQTIVTALAQTLGAVANASERTITRLTDIKKQLEKADVIEDIRRLKARLTECLDTVYEESLRQQVEAARTANYLKDTALIRSAPESGPAAAEELREQTAEPTAGRRRTASTAEPEAVAVNDLRGGPGEREAVEKVLATVLKQTEEAWVGLFKIERASLLVSRFGPPVLEEVVSFVQRRLSSGLDSLRYYRWDQSAILAVLQAREDIKLIRRKINEVFADRLVMNFDIGRREVMLPIGCHWTVLPCFPHHSTHVLIQQIDAFLTEQPVTAKRI
jgi:hypothetical protein